jgi:hypothetical protein
MSDNRLSLRVLINNFPERIKKVIALLAVLAGLALIFLLLGAVLNAFAGSFKPISYISVSDIPYVDRSRIFETAGIVDKSYWSLNEARIKENLMTIAAIKTASVVKRFPDRLTITVEPRSPVACAVGYIDNKIALLYIDGEGVVFEKGAGISSSILPIITDTVTMKDPYPGMRFERPIVELLNSLNGLSQAALSHISEIEIKWKVINGRRLDWFDLIIHLASSPIRVRARAGLTESYIAKILLAVKSEENFKNSAYAGEINYLSDEPVFVPDNGGSR